MSVQSEKLALMMHARHLKRLFQGILAATVLPGCTGELDLSEFTGNVCSKTNALEGLTPKDPVDYLELRNVLNGTVDPTSFTMIAKDGSPCLQAMMPACMEAFTMAGVTEGWVAEFSGQLPGSSEYLVFTRGENVGVVSSLADLKTFLAPIDNAKEASFMALAALPDHALLCRGNNARKVDGGFDIATESGDTCGEESHRDENIVHVTEAGEVSVVESVIVEKGDPNCVAGRRPAGLVNSGASPAEDRVGAFFAEAARLEAASVHAFARFEAELRAFGAPKTLVRDARRARRDEVRHARMTRRLAKRNGATPLAARVRRSPARSLLEFVKENAVEGCVRETFGALVATYQAQHATDMQIASAMSVIAEDETRHAALAWRVAKWAEAKLTPEERAEIVALQREAMAKLAQTIAAKDAPEPRAGLPGRMESLRLLRGLSNAFDLS